MYLRNVVRRVLKLKSCETVGREEDAYEDVDRAR